MKFLLAAEADKIQSMIFRAIRLREVVGGSQLLTDWCSEIANELRNAGIPEGDIVVADGGAFRIILPDKQTADNWAERIAESYYQHFRSTISVAEPVAVDEVSFQTASAAAQRSLRLAKNRPKPQSSCLQNPYAAQCTVCGIGIASEKGQKGKRDLLCVACRKKHALADELSGTFSKSVADRLGDNLRETVNKDLLELLAEHDQRSNVAYLIADGNDMGTLFSACNKEQMKALSKALPTVMRNALAQATAMQTKRVYGRETYKRQTAFPLILGGDDLVVALATPYCLDFARRFTMAYVENMKREVLELGITDFTPSLCAGLVVAKATYPHTLAYERAHQLLDKSKQAARRTKGRCKNLLSFGWASANPQAPGTGGLGVYSLVDDSSDETTLPLSALLNARLALKNIPTSRLVDIHALFDETMLPRDPQTRAADAWLAKLNFLLERAGRKPEDMKSLKQTLQLLGSAREDRLFMRETFEDEPGNALADVLDFWEYTMNLDHDKGDYDSDN